MATASSPASPTARANVVELAATEEFEGPPGQLTVLADKTTAPRWSLGAKLAAGGAVPVDAGRVPGPGQYDVDAAAARRRHRSASAKGSFGKAPRKSAGRLQVTQTLSPGPAYNTDAMKPNVIGGNLGVQWPDAAARSGDRPGPGQYSLPTTLACGGCVSMGEPPKDRPMTAPSGANSPLYFEQQKVVGPAFSIGTGPRPSLAPNALTSAMYVPKTTLGGRTASLRNGTAPPLHSRYEVRPSVGSYMPQAPDPTSPAKSFPKGPRPLSAPPGGARPSNIGPGSYNPKLPDKGCGGCSGLKSSSRKAEGLATRAPGPGAYYPDGPIGAPRRASVGPAFSIGRGERDAGRESAGGCTHNAMLTHVIESLAAEAVLSSPSAVADSPDIGHGQRFAKARREVGETRKRPPGSRPRSASSAGGPGIVYSPNLPGDRRGAVFGSGPQRPVIRSPDKGGGPGPGEYNVDSYAESMRRRAGFRMGGGSLDPKPPDPGPGLYKAYGSFG